MAQPPTPDSEGQLDVRLEWADGCTDARPRVEGDHYTGDEERDDACDGGVVASVGELTPPTGECVDGRDSFETAEERVRAIEAAFGRLAEEPLSVVHDQVRRIRRAIVGAVIAPEVACARVDEVQQFVELRLASLRARPPLAHDGMRQGRASMVEALGLYLEICPLLKALSDSPESDLDRLLARLEEQATRAMLRARDQLEGACPSA